MTNLEALLVFARKNLLELETYKDPSIEGASRTCAVFDPEDPMVFAYVSGESLYYIDGDLVLHECTPEFLVDYDINA